MKKDMTAKEMPVDKIDLSTAFELPHWQVIWASEPSRQIEVRMAYGDLMGIYTKFTKYRWHDLRENPEDFPDTSRAVLLAVKLAGIDYYTGMILRGNRWLVSSGDTNDNFLSNSVIAWKDIEPLGEEK